SGLTAASWTPFVYYPPTAIPVQSPAANGLGCHSELGDRNFVHEGGRDPLDRNVVSEPRGSLIPPPCWVVTNRSRWALCSCLSTEDMLRSSGQPRYREP